MSRGRCEVSNVPFIVYRSSVPPAASVTFSSQTLAAAIRSVSSMRVA